MTVTIIALILLSIGAKMVWGYVVIRLADMGIKHPRHQEFLIELANSKKIAMPSLSFKRIGKDEDSVRSD